MSFEQWWKEEGRFIPPLDQITDSYILEQFYGVAKAAYEKADYLTETIKDELYADALAEALRKKECT